MERLEVLFHSHASPCRIWCGAGTGFLFPIEMLFQQQSIFIFNHMTMKLYTWDADGITQQHTTHTGMYIQHTGQSFHLSVFVHNLYHVAAARIKSLRNCQCL